MKTTLCVTVIGKQTVHRLVAFGRHEGSYCTSATAQQQVMYPQNQLYPRVLASIHYNICIPTIAGLVWFVLEVFISSSVG